MSRDGAQNHNAVECESVATTSSRGDSLVLLGLTYFPVHGYFPRIPGVNLSSRVVLGIILALLWFWVSSFCYCEITVLSFSLL